MHSSQRTWSVGKSLAATVIGAAVQQRLIDVAAPAPVPEWKAPGDPRGRITTDDLLRMASGLNSDHAGNRTDALYFGGIGVAEQAGSWPLVAPPGTAFRYANNDTVLAIRGLQHVLGDGDKALRFPFEAVLWKIGMTRTVPETDPRGHFIMSSQVWTTARDLARLGLLYLNDGMWDGQRLLPADWRSYVARQGPAQPPERLWLWRRLVDFSEGPAACRRTRSSRAATAANMSSSSPRAGSSSSAAGSTASAMNFDLDALTRDVLATLD